MANFIMKPKNGFLIFAVIILLGISQCNNPYEYWDISKFRIDTNALKDGEKIRLIYSSRGPDFNRDLEYYIHIVAVSQKSGDTVNILTTSLNDLTNHVADKTYNFFDLNNPITRLSQLNVQDTSLANGIRKLDDLNNLQMKKISKVARDPKFDRIADNNYPTVIGSIGTMVNNNE